MAEVVKPEQDVILLGMGISRHHCPFDCREIWSCNMGYQQTYEGSDFAQDPNFKPHISKVFMAHTQVWGVKDGKRGMYFNWKDYNLMVENGVEVINTHRIKELKSTMYPYERINKKFGADGFFSDTICYMLAYAYDKTTKLIKSDTITTIVDGKTFTRNTGECYQNIRLYGIDMQTKDEYDTEKGGIEAWMYYGRGLGINVENCGGTDSTVCKTVNGHPYGKKPKVNLKLVDPYGLMRGGKPRLTKAELAKIDLMEMSKGNIGNYPSDKKFTMVEAKECTS
jgi:hypothetical protein